MKTFSQNDKLTVICEQCGHHYQILLAKWKNQNLIIDFAVCPRCSQPRNPGVWEYKDLRSNVCATCRVPFSRITRHGYDTCVMCYFRKRRKERSKM